MEKYDGPESLSVDVSVQPVRSGVKTLVVLLSSALFVKNYTFFKNIHLLVKFKYNLYTFLNFFFLCFMMLSTVNLTFKGSC